MKFVDSVKIHVRSGNGGAGCTAFRREKYIPHGGPDGGDGGKGGDVFLVGDSAKNTLLDLSFQQHQHAEHGINGSGSDRHGRNGKNLYIRVPLGTVVKDIETAEIILEVVTEQDYLLFAGGRGGRGNARFKTSTNRAPEYHQPGEAGHECWVRLELKLMADVGLVGFPNAGKSTLISSVSQARPKIADYPFTTLVPQLGVVKISNLDPFVIADIPGIIAGAHDGKGLGDRFLRHIERTASLLILLDVSGFSENPPEEEYQTLIEELELFSPKLMEKTRAVALTKMDSVSDLAELDKLQQQLEGTGEKVFRISSVSGDGMQSLLQYLGTVVKQERLREKEKVEEKVEEETPKNSIWDD
ncbi:MAG: GTPase ObgE [SAR324 cluster bacterium]|nr:GTPase ObgE [SAR324 cluster bacterium]MBL7035277.1 GTPase ObgE [SAR324 cluster bacterium]